VRDVHRPAAGLQPETVHVGDEPIVLDEEDSFGPLVAYQILTGNTRISPGNLWDMASERGKDEAAQLLDLLLPRMDGFEVLRRLRSNASTQDIPVLVVSNASGLGGREEEARKMGIVDWMVKANTTPATLASRVGRILAAD